MSNRVGGNMEHFNRRGFLGLLGSPLLALGKKEKEKEKTLYSFKVFYGYDSNFSTIPRKCQITWLYDSERIPNWLKMDGEKSLLDKVREQCPEWERKWVNWAVVEKAKRFIS